VRLSATELPPVSPTAGLDVRVATSADLARWDAFVDRCPEATFFHKAGWKEVIGSVFRHRTFYLFAERDATIVGVLPLAQVKSLLFGHTLVSLPFCVYGGVAATDPAAVPALHAAARELAGKLGADHLELRNRIAREPGWPRIAASFQYRRLLKFEDEFDVHLRVAEKTRALREYTVRLTRVERRGRDGHDGIARAAVRVGSGGIFRSATRSESHDNDN